ncbi:MAG: hypothetical protein GY801_52725, partial [bacterium]|nr:hypothetical protein [bacterium]
MALRKQDIYEEKIWPKWLEKLHGSKDNLIFIHGGMGSELFDYKKKFTRWLDLDIRYDFDNLAFEKLSPDGAIDSGGQRLCARDIVSLSLTLVRDPYHKFRKDFRPGIFCYDWRESLAIEAKRLILFLKKAQEQSAEPVSFVTHSMGGCLLLECLGQTKEFDDFIYKIIFCAPPFHGALKPIQIIEAGNGLPVDALVRNRVMREAVATMPGLFQLLVAPPGAWVQDLPDGPELRYPITDGKSLYSRKFWLNSQHLDMRNQVLKYAQDHHLKTWDNIPLILNRLG